MTTKAPAPPRRRPAPERASLTAPRTRPRPPVRTPTQRSAPPRSTPRAAPKTTNRAAPKASPRRTAPQLAPKPSIRPAGPRPGARRRLAILVVLGVLVMLTIVGFHAVLAQNQVALDHTRARIAEAEERYENARLKNSLLSSPALITQRATELGMVPPGVAPISVALPGEAPKRGSETSAFADYTEVKRHLNPSP